MKVTLAIKVILITILIFIMVISFLIKKYYGQSVDSSVEGSVKTDQESVDKYNKRKKEEALQKKIKEEKRSKGNKIESNQDYDRQLTIDGNTPASGSIIDPINLWENYETRTYAGKVRHGEIVTLIKREGDGVLIETKSGLKGWVTYFFIKEFNDE